VQAAVAWIVIFNNFAALHYLFYTKEFTFATYFTKKISVFLVNLSARGLFGPKSAFLRGSWLYFSG